MNEAQTTGTLGKKIREKTSSIYSMNKYGRNRKYPLVDLDIVRGALELSNGHKRKAANSLSLSYDEFMSSVFYYQRHGHTFPKGKIGRPARIQDETFEDPGYTYYETRPMEFDDRLSPPLKENVAPVPDSSSFLYLVLRENELQFQVFQYVIRVMNACACNRTAAAKILGISIRTLRNYLNEMKTNPEWKDLYEQLGKRKEELPSSEPDIDDKDFDYLPKGYDRFAEFDSWNNRDWY